MNYHAALDYILSFTDYERTPGQLYSSANFDLRRVEEFLGRLGNPHLFAKTVHVAGTKGKGSTAAMIASALSAAGYKTGFYTSPHLHTFRERISIDGGLIAEEELASFVVKLQPEIEVVNRQGAYGQLTTFEILTALAFAYFEEKRVDFQVIEVGLGGRLDATNVVDPQVCVITSISFDHTEILGNSLSQIAREKAGIVKPGKIVVSSPQREEAARVIEEVCRERGARLVMVGKDVTWQRESANLEGQSLRVRGRLADYNLTIPLIGDHQLENAATAVAALEMLTIGGVRLSPQSIAAGLSQVRWPGRLEILLDEPMFIVDGAHNVDSARRLGEALRQYFNFGRLILIIGTSSDKDIAGIAGELAPICDSVIATRSRHPRSAAPSAVATEFLKLGVTCVVEDSVASAVSRALGMAQEKGDLICATGSLFIVAEAIECVRGIPPER